jgi:threonine dehydrogenase-like Zn-dependent dehydrogenase
MAEYTVVPSNQVHRLPENVSLELGALVEPMSVAYHAATLGEVNDQSRALMYGAGPTGIGIWFALRGMGLTEIDVVEPSETRRRSIEALGARTLDPTSHDITALIADRTNGDGVRRRVRRGRRRPSRSITPRMPRRKTSPHQRGALRKTPANSPHPSEDQGRDCCCY